MSNTLLKGLKRSMQATVHKACRVTIKSNKQLSDYFHNTLHAAMQNRTKTLNRATLLIKHNLHTFALQGNEV